MTKEINKSGGPQKNVAELSFDTVFPNGDGKFLANELAEVVVGVTNLAAHPTTVFAIGGYFADAKNTSKPIHELPAQRYNIKLETSKQASFPLRFTPEMEAQDFVLVVLIDFFDADEAPRRAIAFEGPVTVVPADFLFDFAGISIIAVFGAGAFIAYKVMTAPKKAAATASATASGTASPAVKVKVPAAQQRAEVAKKQNVLDDEWIPENLKKADKKKK
ncbi:hypothetical protein HDU98_011777 [Podochytrium sp. JEL0797]|nr:hypothetical protein HDU98_011777 [Podochytrium sp. JEL0797]